VIARSLLACLALLASCAAAGEVPASRVPWTVLFDGSSLAGWTPSEFGGQGEVRLEDGALRLEMGSPLTGITWTDAEALPRTDYELELVAARLLGNDFFCGLTFPVGDSWATLVLGGWGGALTGLSCLDGRDASDNETRSYHVYERGRDYRVRLVVTPARIRAWLDDEPIVAVAIAGRTVGLRVEVTRSAPLGVACYATVARLSSLRLRSLGLDPSR